ncbi:winged helix-turn-helix domain-containing protein [Zymobacter palmae]|uniref:Two component transcriptional regulator, winged helix family n=1 Tax=Zymobacter palmae TaxID=33074 RepID=A0A348HE14_9GAMM|nr:response regulator transcription factor [Zymobacter palmae]BBG29866.1 two component transcriptional regulator, winged helix family [Zymobacter palmae]
MRLLLSMNDPTSEKSVKALLETEGYHVNVIEQDNQLLNTVAENDFAALIMDLPTPAEHGVQLLRQLRETSTLPVMVVTPQKALAVKVSVLDIGADDYVQVPFEVEELLARLRMIIRRSAGRASRVIALGLLRIDEGKREVYWQGQSITLARREYALLVAFANHPDQVLTRAYLEQVVYGQRDEVDSNALEVHVHHLRRKLSAMLIDTVRGVGYRFNTPEGDE